MAYDKVIDSAQLDGAMTATADAIRAKTGGTDMIAWDSETGFASTVSGIETGGGAEDYLVAMIENEVGSKVVDSKATYAGSYAFCQSKASVVDLCVKRIYSYTFKDCTTTVLVLRSDSVVTLSNVNAFEGSSFRDSLWETGEDPYAYVYVPEALVEEYRNATNWSLLMSAEFLAIEGSEYE